MWSTDAVATAVERRGGRFVTSTSHPAEARPPLTSATTSSTLRATPGPMRSAASAGFE